jgi:hypothetical protein
MNLFMSAFADWMRPFNFEVIECRFRPGTSNQKYIGKSPLCLFDWEVLFLFMGWSQTCIIEKSITRQTVRPVLFYLCNLQCLFVFLTFSSTHCLEKWIDSTLGWWRESSTIVLAQGCFWGGGSRIDKVKMSFLTFFISRLSKDCKKFCEYRYINSKKI